MTDTETECVNCGADQYREGRVCWVCGHAQYTGGKDAS
jgi:predicted amidophosphoribosyltransferase